MKKKRDNTVQCVNTAVCDESLFLLGAGGEDDPLRDIDGVVADALEVFCCHEHIHCALTVLVFLVHHAREFAFDGGKEPVHDVVGVADELDHNTINIWRAVAAVPLESTDTHKMIDGTIIMPFSTLDILNFLKKDIPYNDIIAQVKYSFSQIPSLTDISWYDTILKNLTNKRVA